ncbi:MAG: hypothetical protein EXQ91_00465 [Alphaproteobacteria bacterium]|nr:hypothetical protein [Alphaproteobacteria bacterium]
MKQGFYSARFKGLSIGEGFAVVVFVDGLLAGASSNEATHSGDSETDPDNGNTCVTLSVTYPPGVGPKAKTGASPVAWGVHITSVMPPDFEGKSPVGSAPSGIVDGVFKFIRGLPGAHDDE